MVRLEEITTILAPVQRCFDLARSVEVHLDSNVHFGEQAIASGGAVAAQERDEVPTGEYDRRLAAIATERELIVCQPEAS